MRLELAEWDFYVVRRKLVLERSVRHRPKRRGGLYESWHRQPSTVRSGRHHSESDGLTHTSDG